MSAVTGHHFAGPTNRFWRLLYESGIVPEPVTHHDDVRLPRWGIGMTNLIARPSPGIDVLRPQEYLEGWRILEQKIAKFRPEIVAFVGVTMYRALWKVLGHSDPPAIRPGFQKATVHGARMFVLPNPSGRNANFSYEEMLDAFRLLRRAMRRLPATTERAQLARHANGAGYGVPASERVGESEGRSPSDPNAPPRPDPPPRAGGASAESAAAGGGRLSRAAGTAARTTTSPPAAAPSRRAPRTRAGSRS